ncbi:hypothetical protein [Catenulispora subtropica]|uniref:Uncharacterized protein n=1 Tax=Catenulispora subtropica TaxID=450798 RepID=A0ABN2R6B5_9ACTN
MTASGGGPARRARDVMRTTCGRELTVNTLQPDPGGHHADRVVLGTSLNRGDLERCWAGLTVEEARQLAGMLLAHAEAVDPAGDR